MYVYRRSVKFDFQVWKDTFLAYNHHCDIPLTIRFSQTKAVSPFERSTEQSQWPKRQDAKGQVIIIVNWFGINRIIIGSSGHVSIHFALNSSDAAESVSGGVGVMQTSLAHWSRESCTHNNTGLIHFLVAIHSYYILLQSFVDSPR